MIRKTYPFLLFVIAVFGVTIICLELILDRLGETLSYTEVLDLQLKRQVLYGTKYSNTRNEYKILGLEQSQPEILALGTSRVMQIRREHFGGTKQFYNAGIDASTGGDFDGMLEILAATERMTILPRVIILEIDPWLFNPNYEGNQAKSTQRYKLTQQLKKRYAFLKKLSLLKNYVYHELIGKFDIYRSFIKEKNDWYSFVFRAPEIRGIGLNSKLWTSGYRLDGSFRYPMDRMHESELFEDMVERLSNDDYRFPVAEHIDLGALAKFGKILSFAKEKNIRLIVLLPPFHPDFLKAIYTSPPHRIFFELFVETVRDAVIKAGFECYDYSSYGMQTGVEGFFDYMHPKEHVMAKIVQSLQFSNEQPRR